VPETTSSTIQIAAPVAAIMSVIADVESYPQWISGLDSVEVTKPGPGGRPLAARFVGNLGMVKDSYTVGYEWQESEVSWHLLEGDKLTALNGRYACEELPGGQVEVVYELSVGLAVPIVGMLRRRGEKVIVDSALKGLKARVEAPG
jgi:uncharacterized membrane protein